MKTNNAVSIIYIIITLLRMQMIEGKLGPHHPRSQVVSRSSKKEFKEHLDHQDKE
jgi:hypothetical protein